MEKILMQKWWTLQSWIILSMPILDWDKNDGSFLHILVHLETIRRDADQTDSFWGSRGIPKYPYGPMQKKIMSKQLKIVSFTLFHPENTFFENLTTFLMEKWLLQL